MFPFPSNGKAHSDTRVAENLKLSSTTSFHSLQTGRHIQTLLFRDEYRIRERWFQFSSNGKAHSDGRSGNPWNYRLCFHSLQTGRHIQTRKKEILKKGGVRFPFPSNGKAHSDYKSWQTWARKLQSFHSLQTGRHIQTKYLMIR